MAYHIDLVFFFSSICSLSLLHTFLSFTLFFITTLLTGVASPLSSLCLFCLLVRFFIPFPVVVAVVFPPLSPLSLLSNSFV